MPAQTHAHASHRGQFYKSVSRYFDRAAEYTGLPDGLLDQVKRCNAVFRMRFPVKQDDGSIQVVEAYRAEHSHHRLPGKKGVFASAQTFHYKPMSAYLATPYRGHWFHIDDNDLDSESTFMLISQLFNPQAGNVRTFGPALIIPVSR